MKRFEGRRSQKGCVVTVNGRPLNPHFEIRNHSPDGFEWGYGGGGLGPAQLALAILAEHWDAYEAQRYYHDFKYSVISSLDHDGWELNSENIDDWFKGYMEAKTIDDIFRIALHGEDPVDPPACTTIGLAGLRATLPTLPPNGYEIFRAEALRWIPWGVARVWDGQHWALESSSGVKMGPGCTII